MTSTEIISKFNLSEKIDYDKLTEQVREFLASNSQDKVQTIVELIDVVSDLDWELYQYRNLLSEKTYSELYSILLSLYALNSSLGSIPNDLVKLDIVLRKITASDKVKSEVTKVFVPIILNLLSKFKIDKSMLKVLNVIVTAMKVCYKYYRKVKLVIEDRKFNEIYLRYRTEVTYFGLPKKFTKSELTSAYRSKVMIVHPDRGGTHDEFLKCKDYYDKLMEVFQ